MEQFADLWWLWLLLAGIGFGAAGTVLIIKHECRPVATCDGYEVDPEKSHPLHLLWATWPFWLLALLSLLLLLGILGYYLCLWLFSTQRDRGEVLPQIL